jgi:hypothetical protein
MIIWLMQRRRSTINAVKRRQREQKSKLKVEMVVIAVLAVSVLAVMAEVAVAVTVGYPMAAIAELAEHLLVKQPAAASTKTSRLTYEQSRQEKTQERERRTKQIPFFLFSKLLSMTYCICT